MSAALIVAGVVVLVALIVWGRRMMQRSNDDKAWVLSKLRGKHVALGIPGGNIAVRTLKGVVVRVDDDTLILRAGDMERAVPLGAIRDIQEGNRMWGPS